jgi:hypothetical protein
MSGAVCAFGQQPGAADAPEKAVTSLSLLTLLLSSRDPENTFREGTVVQQDLLATPHLLSLVF